MPLITRCFVGALALVTLLGPVRAGEIADTASEICPILLGTHLPDATVKTVKGKSVSLRDTIAGSPAVLIVYRGGWCPVCTRQFAGLRAAVGTLQDMGMSLYAMSVDAPEQLAVGREQGSPFTLLSDFELHAATALGLAFHVADSYMDRLADYGLDTAGNAVSTEQVLPVPAVFVLDEEAKITFSYINPDYTDRCDPDVLVAAARTLLSSE
jgi:peroxiredoxin